MRAHILVGVAGKDWEEIAHELEKEKSIKEIAITEGKYSLLATYKGNEKGLKKVEKVLYKHGTRGDIIIVHGKFKKGSFKIDYI